MSWPTPRAGRSIEGARGVPNGETSRRRVRNDAFFAQRDGISPRNASEGFDDLSTALQKR
jgi:hypothetical protein